MTNKIKNLIFSNSLIGGSLILLLTINIFFILNYFFHFAMARMLSIEQYGILVALYSIIYITAIFSESIQLVISRYTTKEKDLGKVKNIIKRSSKKAFKISLYLFVFYLIIALFLSKILKIEYFLIALTGLIIFSSFLMPITRGVLQGKKRFNALGTNMIIESAFKLAFAVLLVFIGWAVYGAIVATLIGVYASLLLSFINIKDVTSQREKRTSTPGIYAYTAPTFVAILAIIIFYSIDVLIAKVFFSPEIAGYYAIISMISKVIFFGTQPISRAMFPISTDSEAKKGRDNIFTASLLILLSLIFIALFVVYFFPGILIRIFSGRFIPEIESILIYPAIAISLISLTNLNILHKLSLGKTKGAYYLIFFVLIDILLLSYFSADLVQFSFAFIAASAAFLWGSIVLLDK